MLHNIDALTDYSATQSFLVVPDGGPGRADLGARLPPTKRQASLSGEADEMAGWHPPIKRKRQKEAKRKQRGKMKDKRGKMKEGSFHATAQATRQIFCATGFDFY